MFDPDVVPVLLGIGALVLVGILVAASVLDHFEEKARLAKAEQAKQDKDQD